MKASEATLEIAVKEYYTILRYVVKTYGTVNIKFLVQHVAAEKGIEAEELMNVVMGV